MAAGLWIVYLVRCSDGTLYCGVTNDLDSRIAAHNAGKGAKYTKSRRPVQLVCASRKMTKSEAFKLEHRVKRLPARRKTIEIAMASR
jgi:putative endonuclease